MPKILLWKRKKIYPRIDIINDKGFEVLLHSITRNMRRKHLNYSMWYWYNNTIIMNCNS